ncbi:APC family permease [Paenibacillus sp. HB172176]|uniref:APC family permease n=1 Tax=Paenibacillus sp. HB172176 TaxID=2493690 RepID=UPI0023F7294A|nr:APC family permease [Paenibacillus sp. HB172176]
MSAISIGIGGMVGGGIFAVLGLSVQYAKGGTPLAFLFGGIIALITSYSYAKLSVRYPSEGGTVEFLNQAFGKGLFSGALNILLWLSYIVMLSLYASAFSSYGAVFLPEDGTNMWKHILVTAVVLLFTVLNISSSKLVGKSEEWIVLFKVIILFVFIGAGFWTIDWHSMEPAEWSNPFRMIAGAMIIFLAYEGFELIANTAGDVKNAARNLPRAYYAAVGFVILLYIAISMVTVGNLSFAAIAEAEDYALAMAAKPFLGAFGFTLIAIAAVLSTASAINATLYGAARVSYVIAKDGELPAFLERNVWRRPIQGLLITTGLTIVFANSFDLSSISTMGSAGFLILFAAVNGANLKLRLQTKSQYWIPLTGILLCCIALVVLLLHAWLEAPEQLWIVAVMVGLSFLIEWMFRKQRQP